MKFEKLPSGSYRVRMTFNGKRYSAVFDHKPTESEVRLKFSDKVNTVIDCEHITFEVAAKEYCKLKKNVISPTTYREYSNTSSRLSEDFNALYIDKITALNVQHEINMLSADKKPKTVKNYYNFIVSVIRLFREDFHPRVTLPEVMQEKVYIPTDKETQMLFDFAYEHTDGKFLIPCILGTYGLRRSEICALTLDDFVDNNVYINKAMVQDVDKNWIIKKYPKTSTSIRTIPIKKEVVELIRATGYIYKGHPNSISDFITKFCKRNNVRHFSLHKLRHYFVSRLLAENVDMKTTTTLSGHKTDSVAKRIYQHEVEEKVKEATNKLDTILFGSGHMWTRKEEEVNKQA